MAAAKTDKAEKKQELIKPETSNVPALFEDMEKDAGQGFEGVGAEDVAVPFLMILQSGSPQLKMGDQKIDGASEGDIFNSVTQEIFKGKEGIHVIPCFFKKMFVEWTPRESGGGFVTGHKDELILQQTKKNERGQDQLPNGNIIVTTAYHYVLLLNLVTGDVYRAMIGMASTQLKKSRRWIAMMSNLKVTNSAGIKFTPPMFSHIYHLTSIPEKNQKGAWVGWQIENAGIIPENRWAQLYTEAKKYSEDIKKGIVKEAVPMEEPIDDTDRPY